MRCSANLTFEPNLTLRNFATPELLKDGIRTTQSLTKRPFAVNLTVLPAISPPPYEKYVEAICEMHACVAAVETAGSNVAWAIEMLTKAGIPVIHKATQVICHMS